MVVPVWLAQHALGTPSVLLAPGIMFRRAGKVEEEMEEEEGTKEKKREKSNEVYLCDGL